LIANQVWGLMLHRGFESLSLLKLMRDMRCQINVSSIIAIVKPWKGNPIGDGTGLENRRAVRSLASSTLAPSVVVKYGAIAQLGERRLCKAEVRGSIPLGSIVRH
jgi:hypothetical protein